VSLIISTLNKEGTCLISIIFTSPKFDIEIQIFCIIPLYYIMRACLIMSKNNNKQNTVITGIVSAILLASIAAIGIQLVSQRVLAAAPGQGPPPPSATGGSAVGGPSAAGGGNSTSTGGGGAGNMTSGGGAGGSSSGSNSSSGGAGSGK
jgi:hypothetical protein